MLKEFSEIPNKARHLNKRAHEIDRMLSEPFTIEFMQLLEEKLPFHPDNIELFFETLVGGRSAVREVPDLTIQQ